MKMSNEVFEKKEITLPQVKKILQSIGDENLDQFQRRTFDYVSKFSKLDADSAHKLKDTLITEFDLDDYEAIQIINCMPKLIIKPAPTFTILSINDCFLVCIKTYLFVRFAQ